MRTAGTTTRCRSASRAPTRPPAWIRAWPPLGYAGPDNAAASVTGSCADRAGNATTRSFGLKYDATDPQVGAAPSRVADRNGWYNHALSVSFAGSDVTSGLDVCDPVKSYASPDSANAVVSGKCWDQAGNDGLASFALKYDATGPQVEATPDRAANAAGWYRARRQVRFAGTDATSGDVSCVPKTSYAGPDVQAASVSGSCSDQAGNTTGRRSHAQVRRDQAFREPCDAARGGGRQRLVQPLVAVSFRVGMQCPGWALRPGADLRRAGQLFGSGRGNVCGCRRQRRQPLVRAQVRPTPPIVTPTPARNPDSNGWYRQELTVSFAGADATSGIATCTAPKTYSGPDAAAASAGSCTTKPATAPCVVRAEVRRDAAGGDASPGRAPDTNGWYNRALTVSFDGADATSGLDSCARPELRRPRQRHGLGERLVQRPGREHWLTGARLPVRPDRASGHRLHALARARRERLVQRSADGHLPRNRRDVGSRLVRRGRLQRPG